MLFYFTYLQDINLTLVHSCLVIRLGAALDALRDGIYLVIFGSIIFFRWIVISMDGDAFFDNETIAT